GPVGSRPSGVAGSTPPITPPAQSGVEPRAAGSTIVSGASSTMGPNDTIVMVDSGKTQLSIDEQKTQLMPMSIVDVGPEPEPAPSASPALPPPVEPKKMPPTIADEPTFPIESPAPVQNTPAPVMATTGQPISSQPSEREAAA